jgi:hypothetical protein
VFSPEGAGTSVSRIEIFMRLKLACILLLLPVAAYSQQAPSADQQRILDLTNQARAQQGRGPLQWDPALAAAAQAHVQRMVDQHTLSHQLPGEPDLATRAGLAGAHFRAIAENIAMAGSLNGLQNEWMKSPPHRANILDPRMDHVGVGLIQRGGYWYAAVVFDSAVASLSSSQVEQEVAALLRQRGISQFRPPEAARKDCTLEEGDASGTRPRFIMRWEGTSFNRLPGALEQRLQSGRYTAASVGACSSQTAENQGFTTYSMAVLLY